MLENELLEHKIKESSARQLHLDTLKEANIKTLSDSVKISNETATAALLDLDTVRFQSAKNEISDSITLDFDLKDSVATNNLQNIISAVKPLIRESREASPMLDEIMLRKQLQTAVIERDTAVSDMDIQEMQHLAEMEALESNLESVQYRLDTLSAENDILRQQASGASAQNYGRMSDIFTPFDTSTSPGYGTINSLSDQTDPSLLNDQVAARITIENLEAEVTRLQLALTATERANSIATEEFEHIKANLVADLAASEKALFENNERDAIFLTTRNENQKSVITANTDFIETQRMKIADYEKDTAISDNETINSYKQELQVSLVRSAVAEQRIVMLEAELLKVTDDQKKLGLDHNKNMLDIAAKKEEINALEKQLQAVQLNIEIRNRELESTTALNQQSSNDIDTLSYWLSTENDLKNFDTSSICSTPKLIQIVEDIKKTQFHLEHRIQHDSKFEEQAHVVAHQTNIIEGLRQLLREKEESYAILLAQLDSKQVLASNSDSTSRSINFKESSTQYDDWIRDDVGKDSRELIQLKLQLKSLESAVDTEKSVSASLKQNLDDELAKNNQLQENCLTLINNLEKLKVDSKIASDKETFDVLKSRNDALSRQLRSTPPSLLVAQAEKRVLECRLSQLKDELQICLTDEQKKSAQIQFELNAFMRREEIEKGALLQKIQSQSQTIHQLTRHLNQLQTSIQKEESFGNSGLSGTANPILPLPWPLSDPLQEKWGGDALMLRVTSDKQDISSEQKSHFQLASSGNGNQVKFSFILCLCSNA